MRSRWTGTTTGTLHPLATTLRNGDEVVRFFTAAFEAVGELQMDVTDIHESGDTAIAQWRLRTTVVGEVAGLRPSGSQIDVRGIDVQRIVEGRVVHADVYFDGLTVARQLGVLPGPGSLLEGAVRRVVNATTAVDRLGRRLAAGIDEVGSTSP